MRRERCGPRVNQLIERVTDPGATADILHRSHDLSIFRSRRLAYCVLLHNEINSLFLLRQSLKFPLRCACEIG
ncbi:hypothetical protein J2797_006418 [Paraburkholderia terricola]|nr:hypothetical protein [Paraburkholderia terricola]